MLNMADIEYILRLLIAAFCGVLIGYERKNRSKVAGVRTHCVVACASALMMLLSKYAYTDVMAQYGELMKIDPSRIASGVVSGIGFLGAGMIFINQKTVTGLTTAAGVWATAGVGMAIGAGMYWIGGAAAVLILLIQIILHMTPRFRVHHADDAEPTMILKHGEVIDIVRTEETDDTGRAVYTLKVAVLPGQGNKVL